MSKRKYFLIGTVLGLLLFYPFPSYASEEVAVMPAQGKTFGTWFWETSMIQTHPNEVLTFIEEKQVNQLYLQINRKIDVETYRWFIEQAAARNIEVHALDGGPNWVSPEGGKYRDQFFDWVMTYQNSATPAQQFRGIHLDVEPYLYKGWKEDYQNTVSRFQDFIDHSYSDSRKMNLKLTLAVPFWYDNRQYSNKYGEGNLGHWVIQNTDQIAIMAYRDRAEEIIKLVEQEILWAKELNKQVLIGAETKETAEGDKITFYEEGSTVLFDQLDQVYARYAQVPSFNGFAIHSLRWWMELKP